MIAMLPVTAVAAVFYLNFTGHLPWHIRLAFLTPLLALNYFAGVAAWRLIRFRLGSESISLWPESIFALLLLVAFFALGLHRRFPWLPPLLLVAYGWLFAQIFLRRLGNFYTVFAGLLVISGVFLSYFSLHAAERLLYFILHARRAAVKQAAEPRTRIVAGRGVLRIRVANDPALRMRFGDGLYYHGRRGLEFDYSFPARGRPLFFLSAGSEDPGANPLLGFHDVTSKEPLAPGDFRRDLEMVLGHMRNSGRVKSVEYAGTARRKYKGGTLNGIFFNYRENFTNRPMRFGLYLLTSPSARTYALYLREPRRGPEKKKNELIHHPDLTTVLNALEWEARAKGDSPAR